MFSYIFSGFLNLAIFVCFVLFIISLIAFIIFSIMKFFEKEKFKDNKENEQSTAENAKIFKFSSVFLLCATTILYLFNCGFTSPSETSEVMKQRGEISDKEMKEIEDKKNAEKLDKERKKAEEKAEEERKRQEKLVAEQEKERQKQQEKIDKKNADKNNHDFIEISAQSLMNELESNAARANKNFNGKYVKITNAVVTNIESDGDFINVNSSDIISLTSIQCFPKYESTKEQIFNLNNGQIITVYGKIKDVGEVIGYYFELLKIE